MQLLHLARNPCSAPPVPTIRDHTTGNSAVRPLRVWWDLPQYSRGLTEPGPGQGSTGAARGPHQIPAPTKKAAQAAGSRPGLHDP